MLYKHFTEKLLGLQGLNVTNIEENEKIILIYAEMERKEHTCISCGTATNTIHDYREQVIKDIPAFGKLVSIVLRKRRYRCKNCGKRFFECNPFLHKYHRMTNRLSAFIIDKYHWIRQAIWAFENVRKEEQKKLSPELKKYYKRSKSLLIKRFDGLEEFQKQQVNVMLYYSANISRAYFYKEQFLKILNNKDANSARKAMSKWIQNAENCGIPQFEKCAETMRNWYNGIINSFSTTITNGFTEGCNKKIKVLKRNAYGYQNFKRFRNRILHIFSHQQLNKEQAAA